MTDLAESPAGFAPAARARRATPCHRLARDVPGMVALGVIALLVLAALLAPWIAPADPYLNNMRIRLQPPGAAHWLGTDNQGRDLLTRLLFGLRTTLLIGVAGVACGGLIGAAIGLVAAYFRRLDGPLMRLIDILLSFPAILFGLALAGVLGAGLGSLVIALSIAAVPPIARVARGAATGVMQQEYIEGGRAIGLGDGALLWRYLARNCLPTILVYLTLQLGQTILLGAALNFLGLGAQPPTAELGSMAAEGRRFLRLAPYASGFPCGAIFLVVLAFNVLGDALRDAFDPKLRR